MITDMFRPLPVPEALQPFVRRLLIGRAPTDIDATIPVRASGYLYLG